MPTGTSGGTPATYIERHDSIPAGFEAEVSMGQMLFPWPNLQHQSTEGMKAYGPVIATVLGHLSSEEGRHRLHSVDSRTCVVTRIYSNFGDRMLGGCQPKAVEQPSSWS